MLYSVLAAQQLSSEKVGSLDLAVPTFRDVLRGPRRVTFEQAEIVARMNKHLEHEATNPLAFRGKQKSIYEDLRDFFDAGLTKGLIRVPPRVGKGFLTAKVVAALDMNVVIATESKVGVKQILEEVARQAPHLTLGVYAGKRKDLDAQVLVGTYTSLVRGIDSDFRDGKFRMLFEDEGHRALTELRRPLMTAFQYVISLTGTDRYSVDKAVSNYLPDCVHYMDLREAIADGLLCDVEVRGIRTRIDASSVQWKQDHYESAGLLRLMMREDLATQAAQLHQERHRGEIGLGVCRTVEQARYFADTFSSLGIPSCAVSSEDRDSDIMRAVDAHRSGAMEYLFHAGLLNQSYDNPRITVVHAFEPSDSLVLVEQSRTRGLTLDPENPGKKSVVYEWYYEDRKGRSPGLSLQEILDGEYVVPIRAHDPGRAYTSATPLKPDSIELEVGNLRVLVTGESIRSYLSDRREKEQKWKAFSPQNLLRLMRAVGKDHEIDEITTRGFQELRTSDDAARYLSEVELSRWPRTSNPISRAFGSFATFKSIALLSPEIGRLNEEDVTVRQREILPILRLLQQESLVGPTEWSMLDDLRLDELEETLLAKLPGLSAGGLEENKTVISEWILSYHRGHIETYARRLTRDQPYSNILAEDLVTTGSLELLRVFSDMLHSRDAIDRLKLLERVHKRMKQERNDSVDDYAGLEKLSITEHMRDAGRWAVPIDEFSARGVLVNSSDESRSALLGINGRFFFDLDPSTREDLFDKVSYRNQERVIQVISNLTDEGDPYALPHALPKIYQERVNALSALERADDARRRAGWSEVEYASVLLKLRQVSGDVVLDELKNCFKKSNPSETDRVMVRNYFGSNPDRHGVLLELAESLSKDRRSLLRELVTEKYFQEAVTERLIPGLIHELVEGGITLNSLRTSDKIKLLNEDQIRYMYLASLRECLRKGVGSWRIEKLMKDSRQFAFLRNTPLTKLEAGAIRYLASMSIQTETSDKYWEPTVTSVVATFKLAKTLSGDKLIQRALKIEKERKVLPR